MSNRLSVYLSKALVFGVLTVVLGLALSTPALAMETIDQMVTRLCAANKLPRSIVKQAVIQQSNQINAGTDGQNIIVYSGLWNQLTTDDARAFVVGHELGHIVLHHTMKAAGRQLGYSLLSRLAGNYLSPIASTATSYGFRLTELKFDRGQEYQADDEGLKLMWKAGYDPHSVNQVFAVLNKTDTGGTPEFLLTHPLSKKRLDDLVAKYDRLGPAGGTAARNYQSLAPDASSGGARNLSVASGQSSEPGRSWAGTRRATRSNGSSIRIGHSWLDTLLNPKLP